MKQIKINSKCDGCGLCIVQSPYIEENGEGNAQPVRGMAIRQEDIEKLKKIESECPQGAIEIVDAGSAKKKGIAGVEEVIKDLRKKCEAISVRTATGDEIRLDIKKYPIPIPSTSKEYKRDYSSESAARSAAKEELKRLCYSEYAYRPILKKVFVEYKVDKLKKFYNTEDGPNSFYYEYNELVRGYLADAYAEICDLVGSDKIDESWREFSFYITDSDCYDIKYLKEFDDMSTSFGIIKALKDMEYSDLDYYASDFEYDYLEEYTGTGLFGDMKFKKKWYFHGFTSCAKQFIDDLTWAIEYQSMDIEESVEKSIAEASREFESGLKDAFEKKIRELEEML